MRRWISVESSCFNVVCLLGKLRLLHSRNESTLKERICILSWNGATLNGKNFFPSEKGANRKGNLWSPFEKEVTRKGNNLLPFWKWVYSERKEFAPPLGRKFFPFRSVSKEPSLTIVCVEVLRISQPNGVMSSAVSLPNHMFTGQAYSSKRLNSIVHILSPVTDNCPSWISRRERINVENITWPISTKEWCEPGGGRTRNLLISKRIQLSHRGRLQVWRMCLLRKCINSKWEQILSAQSEPLF